MDVGFSNVLEGTRQYFLGLPKASPSQSSAPRDDIANAGQPFWPDSAAPPPPSEGAIAQSGAPAMPNSRPPSVAAAHPPPPPRPPSEPIEPEPHIIHKATVMREALQKQREEELLESERPPSEPALSPPSHIIHKPPHALPPKSLSPAVTLSAATPAPAETTISPQPAPVPLPPCPSPSRAPVASPYRLPPTVPTPPQPRPPTPASRPVPTPDLPLRTATLQHTYRPPSAPVTRLPTEHYLRYPHDSSAPDARPLSSTSQSPQPYTRQSPHQTYARISAPSHHETSQRQPRMRDNMSEPSPPVQRYQQPAPPPNDRVPPIHHPSQIPVALQPQPAPPALQRHSTESRSTHAYSASMSRIQDPYSRITSGYERNSSSTVQQNTYREAHTYPSYPGTVTARLAPVSTAPPSTRQFADATNYPATSSSHSSVNSVINQHYPPRPSDHSRFPPSRVDYSAFSKQPEASTRTPSRSTYPYAVNSSQTFNRTSISSGVATSTPALISYPPQPQPSYRPAPTGKATYETTQQVVHTSPTRGGAVKTGFASHQPRPTVSVTSLVNQMNQTKQKRESPLDLSVKTVKNSADSTAQDEAEVSSGTQPHEHPKIHQPQRKDHPAAYIAPARHHAPTHYPARASSSHKVDFSPNFHSQYVEKNSVSRLGAETNNTRHTRLSHTAQNVASHNYNGAYENTVKTHVPRPAPVPYHIDNSYQTNYKYPSKRIDHSLPRIDLTPAMGKEQQYMEVRPEHRYALEDSRKRLNGPVASNIPEKVIRYDTFLADSRDRSSIDRLRQSAQEQHKLMSQPVYSYSSHKQFQAYQNERVAYHHATPHYSEYPSDSARHNPIYNTKPTPIERYPNNRHIIQKIPQHLDHSGGPADKRVLSILRNSLETKNMAEPPKPPRQIGELIIIDDDPIEITDLTKENETAMSNEPRVLNHLQPPSHKLHLPRAVDSIKYDSDNSQKSINFDEFMAGQKKLDLEIASDVKNKSPDSDVASRIRTKGELKGFTLPVPKNIPGPVEIKQENSDIDCLAPEIAKLQPKSQKAHLFSQLYEEKERLESVIKSEITSPMPILLPGLVKSEPMNIDEIEKDAINPLDIEDEIVPAPQGPSIFTEEDELFWASTCDNFVAQLKTRCTKKKARRKRVDTIESETVIENVSKVDHVDKSNNVEKELISNSNVELSKSDIAIPESSTKPKEKEVTEKEDVEEPTENPNKNKEMIVTKSRLIKESVNANLIITENNVSDMNKKEKTKTGKEPRSKRSRSLDQKDKKSRPDQEDRLKRRSLERKSMNTEIVDRNRKSESQREKRSRGLRERMNKDNNEMEQKTDNKRDILDVIVKQEPIDENNEKSNNKECAPTKEQLEQIEKSVTVNIVDIIRSDRNGSILLDKIKKEVKEKDESESTDDDEPLIKSKLLKDRNSNAPTNQKAVFVKLECCDATLNKSPKENGDSNVKVKQKSKVKQKGTLATDLCKKKTAEESSSPESDADDLTVASRLRVRKCVKTEETKTKNPAKATPSKIKLIDDKCILKKNGFGDGSDFRPGWERELYEYKRSLRMPSRLINVPRNSNWNRISTSLPDLDPSPISPAPSTATAAGTGLDSDLESNSSCYKINYDSEASNSTVFSQSLKSTPKKNESILDVLIQKYGRKDDSKRKSKEDPKLRIIAKCENSTELLPTPSLGLTKSEHSKTLTVKKEKMDDGYYLGSFRKETVSAFRNHFIKDTNGRMGATESFDPVILKTRTRTESKVFKKRTIIKEVFGDERPASAPPTSCREEEPILDITVKKESEDVASKPKSVKKICKLKQKSRNIRDGLRSTSLKKCDAKGRLLRLKKRNNFLKVVGNKKGKELNKLKKDHKLEVKRPSEEEKNLPTSTSNIIKKRFKRLFARRKFSSGFDYIRKKKKIIKKDEEVRVRRIANVRPNPESVHDIQKEIKGWIINKSIGETPLHRAARLGYTDCVAYCLEKMGIDPTARDNAGFSPLHVAAAKGHLQIARLLLQYGANVSAAATGGIRPLHEACENEHVEMIRLLLAYGADPLLATYAGQTPTALADGAAAKLLRQYIGDVQGTSVDPWTFPEPSYVFDLETNGHDPLASPPAPSPPSPDTTIEFLSSDAPLPPFYSLKPQQGQPSEGYWCLLSDVTAFLQIKSRDALLKQIHSGPGSPRDLLRELRTQEFLERAHCHQLLGAGEKVNVRASKVALIRVTDKLRQLFRIETTVVS